ncbi:MAG: hypothetical protein HKO93_06300 [Flavobacteriales bacterium]|nr:hypothetical protein [Flavobacteriales bacterium]
MQTLQRLPSGDTPESLFIKKNGSFKYLEFNPIPQISLGLFEAVMWNRFDPIKGTVSLDGMAYSPLIGTSAIALGLNDAENNALLGLDLSLRPIYEVLVYGQLIVDREERTGHQIGARTIDLGVQGLSIRAEYNSVEPFTYSNEIARQNYGHFAQAIAHPMGAGFDELSLGVTHFYKRWFMDAAYVRADQLIDPINEENYCAAGGDIFSTTQCTNEVELNAYQAELNHFEMRLGRMFNPNSNFNAYLGWLFRERSGAQSTQSQSMFSFGVEMSLYNRYEDF